MLAGLLRYPFIDAYRKKKEELLYHRKENKTTSMSDGYKETKIVTVMIM
jgi:hypothetical protein